MTYCICKLDQHGHPAATVYIDSELHSALIRAARQGEVFADYYEHAEVPPSKLAALLKECNQLQASVESTRLTDVLQQLCLLIAEAIAEGRSVRAIAD